jgi:hypothetical protein
MKTKDLIMTGTAAIGTATLTVAAFWAGPLDAGNDTDSPPPKIAQPLLVTRGIEVSLAPAGGRVFQAGDQPAFELTALNTTHEPVTASLCVTMSALGPGNPMSRVPLLPLALWRQAQIVTLKPDETRVYLLCANTNLPAKSVISVSLQDLDEKPARRPGGIMVLTFSTASKAPAPALASAR